MAEIVEIHPDSGLQEAVQSERKGTRLGDLLRQEMDGGSSRNKWKWKTFKLSLRLNNGMSCCGRNWSSAAQNMETREDSDDDEVQQIPVVTTGMNLMTALAAERQFRAAQEWEANNRVATWTPRVSLIRLLQEEANNGGDEEKGGSSVLCSVCEERKKGAALIPCGHTFCRVCSREIWLNPAACPLCNRSVVEILDIF